MRTWHLPFNPYKVQKVATDMCGQQDGLGLFMEMGLGKTAVAINDFVEQYRQDKVRQMLVLCPAHLRGNWVEEIKKYEVGIDVYMAPNVPPPMRKKPAIWVVNFQALLSSVGPYVDEYVGHAATMIVVDESQNIKNFKAKTTKRALQLAFQCPVRRALSGKPMTQSVMDLWSQIRFVGGLSGVNPYQFRNSYALMGGYMGKQVVGIRNEGSLRGVLKQWAFQASKDDWIDLPAKLPPRIVEVEMLPEQRRAYDKMRNDQVLPLSEKEVVTADMVISAMMKLQQISSGFVIDNLGKAHDIMPPEKNPKIVLLKEELDGAEGKSIIFAHFNRSIDMLHEALSAQYGTGSVAVLRGGMKKNDLEDNKNRFNVYPGCRFIIGQISAAKEGHTLLGGKGNDRCKNTFYFENTYSLGDRAQSEDRNHRIGQDQPVSYVDFVTSPIDRRVIAALQKKESIVKAVMG